MVTYCLAPKDNSREKITRKIKLQFLYDVSFECVPLPYKSSKWEPILLHSSFEDLIH